MPASPNAARAELKQRIFAVIEDVCARMPKDGMPSNHWINARVIGVMVWVDEYTDRLAEATVQKCVHALPATLKSDGYYSEARDEWNHAIEASVQALCAPIKPDTPSPAAQPETDADKQDRLIADYFGVTVDEVRRVRAGATPATPADGRGG